MPVTKYVSMFVLRSLHANREDARAALPDEQVKSAVSCYPVDRYLVPSSKNIEMVNILDDELWNSEPAMKPEDEILLRKLHEMLQTTASDLKLLSGELSKYHEPGVQVKSTPIPFDDEFNEKVHIEEVVNAKFHGYKLIDKSVAVSAPNHERLKTAAKVAKTATTAIQATLPSSKPVPIKNLGISRTKVVQINENPSKVIDKTRVINIKKECKEPTVIYNEFSYTYNESKVENEKRAILKIQEMPSINIRSQLKQQKVLQLDIMPVCDNETKVNTNVGVVEFQHEPAVTESNFRLPESNATTYKPVRKVTKLSAYESSVSTNNTSSDTKHVLNTQKLIRNVISISPKRSPRVNNKKGNVKKPPEKRSHNLDEWKKKLNSVYGNGDKSKARKTVKSQPSKRSSTPSTSANQQRNALNNAVYVPYSQLTLGGVRVSDIEKEIIDLPNKNDIPLSPILDKILSSREHSFKNESPRHNKKVKSPKILTTSDENLLQEVIEVDRISKTLAKATKTEDSAINSPNMNEYSSIENSYADDFEDEEDNSKKSNVKENLDHSQLSSHRSNRISDSSLNGAGEIPHENSTNTKSKGGDKTFTKALNLSFKSSVDIFEFIHSVDRQDNSTQSASTSKISLKETQTSPRNDRQNIQPIHNDLWSSSIDPKGEVNKMFTLEKDFIKQLIIEEYGDLMAKNINKPSTSKDERNIVMTQRITQTSPARCKNVTTSPTKTKTRTTSPLILASRSVDQQTSPLAIMTDEQGLRVEVQENADDLGISINLSSPRFSLRLPQSSTEVLSNLEISKTSSKDRKDAENLNITKTVRRKVASSTSSVDGDNSSSEISSLGEINVRLKRRLRKGRVPTMSETSTSSAVSLDPLSGVLPLRSEGELSWGHTIRKRNTATKSDGEMSLGLL